jgi:hypothetical protein
VSNPASCWRWKGRVDGFGYGIITNDAERDEWVHNLSCRLQVGPIPSPSLKACRSGRPVGPYDPFGSDRNCGDFSTWQDAQVFYEYFELGAR